MDKDVNVFSLQGECNHALSNIVVAQAVLERVAENEHFGGALNHQLEVCNRAGHMLMQSYEFLSDYTERLLDEIRTLKGISTDQQAVNE